MFFGRERIIFDLNPGGAYFAKPKVTLSCPPFSCAELTTTVNLPPNGRFGVKILQEWLQLSHWACSRKASASPERFIKKDTGNMQPFETLTVCALPRRNSNALLSCVTCWVPTTGKRHWKFNEFKKSCAGFPFGEALGKRGANRKKTFKEIMLPPRVASIGDNDRELEMDYFGVPIYLQGWFHYCASHPQGKDEGIWSIPEVLVLQKENTDSHLRATDMEIKELGGQCLHVPVC